MNESEVELHLLRTAYDRKWTLQPNRVKRMKLVKSMAKKARGDIVLCPCKIFVEGIVDVAQVKCPCGEAEADINENGSCHCGIFIRHED